MNDLKDFARPRRPALSDKRIRGLEIIAERVRGAARARPGSLYGFSREESSAARAALQYMEELIAWREQLRGAKP